MDEEFAGFQLRSRPSSRSVGFIRELFCSFGLEWYAGLTLQKKPVDFVLFPAAVHIGVKMSQRAATQEGIVDWFRFWLEGEEESNPENAGQYARWRGLRKMQQENDEVKAKAAPAN